MGYVTLIVIYRIVNVELRDTVLLLQSPEMLLQGLLPTDISIDEVKLIHPPGIQRAVKAIREEKLRVRVTIDI